MLTAETECKRGLRCPALRWEDPHPPQIQLPSSWEPRPQALKGWQGQPADHWNLSSTAQPGMREEMP